MAMDALRHLVANVPDWLKRLDDLNGQIEQRQIELAALTESQSSPGSPNATGGRSIARSLRNKGSTESLKPRDEPEAHPEPPQVKPGEASRSSDADGKATVEPVATPAPKLVLATTRPDTSKQIASPGSSSPPQRKMSAVKAAELAGKARARAMLRKRHRTESMVSLEDATPRYRTHRMIIVYYDSYVQSFFEELVKFVSASRNMMRKAKMAAKVAQIKRLAEMEMSDDDDNDDLVAAPAAVDLMSQPSASAVAGAKGSAIRLAAQVGGVALVPAPALSGALIPDPGLTAKAVTRKGDDDVDISYDISSWRLQSVRRSANMMMLSSGRPTHARAAKVSLSAPEAGGKGEVPTELYEELDKGLEFVQSTSEHAAHQFLRDGDCTDEVMDIQGRLRETRAMAERELERIRNEEPEALSAALLSGADEARAARVLRHPRMAREAATAATATVVVGKGSAVFCNELLEPAGGDSDAGATARDTMGIETPRQKPSSPSGDCFVRKRVL